ncbi:MAG: TonB-dependent receptor plug domain-containing protein, partial [Sphingomonadaceae bacterium]
AGLAPVAAFAAPAAEAAGRTFAFDIPAQPLSSALLSFSRTTGRQILVAPALTERRTSRPAKGLLSAEAGLERLLAGSGLSVRASAGGVLMIAQEPGPAPPPGSAEAPEPVLLSELIVTTQKRPQSAGDVPLAISVVGGEEFERHRVAGLSDVARSVPGLTVSGGSLTTMGFSIRGITQNSGDATREPRVSVFQDGVSASRARGAYFELFDLERVEVARGPQSTLFGRSAMTGAVDVIQNKASLAASTWRLTAAAGDGRAHLVEGVANIAGDGAAARLAFRSRQWDGGAANVLGERADSEAVNAARLAIRWSPDDAWLADLIINHEQDGAGAMPVKALQYATIDPASRSPSADLGRHGHVALSGRDEIGAPAALGLDRVLTSAALLADWRPTSPWRISSVTGLRRFDADERQDADGFGLPVLTILEETRGWQASQELRLHYEGERTASWFAGVNLFHESGTQRATFVVDERLLMARMADAIGRSPQTIDALTSRDDLASWISRYAAQRGKAIGREQAMSIAGRLAETYVERNQ